MPKLYHGTNGAWVNNILRVGLEPRQGKGRARNNWTHVPHQSNPKCVYLTDSYAPFFAFNAARGKNRLCAVIEVDTDRLDPENLWADEDCLEQVTRGKDDLPVSGMSQRTLWYRQQQFEIVSMTMKDGTVVPAWEASLRALGTCSHQGVIPRRAITRIACWPDNRTNAYLHFVWDPTITLLNQAIVGDRYRALTAKLFGDEPDRSAFTNYFDGQGNPVENPEWAGVEHFDPSRIEDLSVYNVNLTP